MESDHPDEEPAALPPEPRLRPVWRSSMQLKKGMVLAKPVSAASGGYATMPLSASVSITDETIAPHCRVHRHQPLRVLGARWPVSVSPLAGGGHCQVGAHLARHWNLPHSPKNRVTILNQHAMAELGVDWSDPDMVDVFDRCVARFQHATQA
jgi:hypothetical protein